MDRKSLGRKDRMKLGREEATLVGRSLTRLDWTRSHGGCGRFPLFRGEECGVSSMVRSTLKAQFLD